MLTWSKWVLYKLKVQVFYIASIESFTFGNCFSNVRFTLAAGGAERAEPYLASGHSLARD